MTMKPITLLIESAWPDIKEMQDSDTNNLPISVTFQDRFLCTCFHR